MYSGLIPLIKKAAVDAVDSTQPVAIVFGKVTSEVPLKVQVTPKLTLGASNLVVPDHLTKKILKIPVIKGYTGYSGNDENHRHTVASPLELEFDNSLKAGDSVILLRLQGGDRYLVVDKAVTE